MINNIPLTDAELKEVSDVPRHALDEFARQTQRNPTRCELKYLGRWNPQQAIRQAELNPDGEPDKLVAIKIPQIWQDVSFYCELAVSQIHGSKFGIVSSLRSVRYHDGDDSQWPMRTSAGELVRSDGGHLIKSPTFRAPHMMVEPVSQCDWPKDVGDKGMWHVLEILRPIHVQLVDKKIPTHLVVESHALRIEAKPTRESELEKRIAELENQAAKNRR